MKNRTYRYFTGKPLYAFGHGLSYSKFEYSNLRVAAATPDTLRVTLDVANVSALDGDEVVQLYSTPPTASQPQEIRALCGFQRVQLKAGSKQTLSLTVPAIALRRWNVDKKDYAIPSGPWTIAAGSSSADLRQTTQVNL
jgi:beta-glucosidase